MKQWNMKQEDYRKKILSVSTIPDFFKQYLPQTGVKNIVFLACGPAFEVISINEVFPNYFWDKNLVFVDSSEKWIPMIEQNIQGIASKHTIKISSMDEVDLPDGFADIVICINGLLYESIMASTLNEVGRLLKKGGVFLANSYPPYEDYEGRCFLELPEFHKNLAENLHMEYLSPRTPGENAYFVMLNQETGDRQVCITDQNIRNIIEKAAFKIELFERYTLPPKLVSEVRHIPLQKIIDGGYKYQTSVWVLVK